MSSIILLSLVGFKLKNLVVTILSHLNLPTYKLDINIQRPGYIIVLDLITMINHFSQKTT